MGHTRLARCWAPSLLPIRTPPSSPSSSRCMTGGCARMSGLEEERRRDLEGVADDRVRDRDGDARPARMGVCGVGVGALMTCKRVLRMARAWWWRRGQHSGHGSNVS